MKDKSLTALLLLLILIVTLLFFIAPDLFLNESDTDTGSSVVHAETVKNQSPMLRNPLSISGKDKGAISNKLVRPTVVPGFDWQLPVATPVSPGSGMVDEIYEPTRYANMVFVRLPWSQINPARNHFDFSLLETALNDTGTKKLLIRLEVNSACEAPKWALKQLRSSKRKSLIFWDRQYPELLKPLINAFAKKYAANPRISGVQLGIGDGEFNGSCSDFSHKDGWGEFWMSDQELAEAEDDFGLTAALFDKRTRQIIDIYANAFGQNRGKLAFTNIDPYFSWGERSEKYDRLMPGIAHYVMEKGLGNRDGEVEVWMRYVYNTYGVYFKKYPDKTCSLEMDESFARKIRGRYWGTENEFYGTEDYILDYGGPRENQPYRFMVSSLRALQMRRNVMAIHSSGMSGLHHPIYKTQAFMTYLAKTLGKQLENTPDAFVLLGERYITADRVAAYSQSGESCINKGKVKVRSFGRWLTENSNSTPALKINMPASEKKWSQGAYLPEGMDYEYAARQASRFSFNLNDKLANKRCQTGCKVSIKLTFKDIHKTSLWLTTAEGKTMPFNTAADNKIKTVSFQLNSRFNNALHGSDFLLDMKRKLPLIMVRMVFLNKSVP